MKISLCGRSWRFRGHWPHTPLFGRSMETGAPMGAVTHWMPATVPGCVIQDLLDNNVIEDPYYEQNSLRCEWVENRWWVYQTAFILDEACRGQDIALVFEGVDYRCHIFLNGEKLCEHEGMFQPIRLDIAPKARWDRPNDLEVVLESPPDEMGQIGRTSQVRTQTSRFGYKWDYGTRLVHSGIWQDVYLDVTPGARIDNVHIVTGVEEDDGVVDVTARLRLTGEPCELMAQLCLDGTEVALHSATVNPEEQAVSFRLRVEDPALWWPNGHGAQPLYGLSVRLMRGDRQCDRYDARVGIRSLEYQANEGAAAEALPYTVVVNGRRIYIKGVNISPLDHRIGSISTERYERLLTLIRDGHINMVRVWGGGITEKEAFYDLCDHYGILVWQEFNQSSSGIDNVPPRDPGFLRLLRANAEATLLRRRNHVCLALWNGGNELMDAGGVPASYADENIAMLRALVEELDPQRLFLPTSASGPSEFLDVSPQGLGRNHDVHGPWQYQGPQRHYEMYNLSDSLLHSEFGTDGFTNYSSVTRFLSPDNRRPSNVKDNLVWRHHGEWWDTTQRDQALFGPPRSLRQMIACSQFLQAEGLRYAVEANRRRAFHNSGSIIWQFNEPWPNLFNTCMVDCFGTPKGAYWWVKRGYAPLTVTLRYDRLVWEPGSVFRAQAWLSDDACAYEGPVEYRITDLWGHVLREGAFPVCCAGSHSVQAGEIEFADDGIDHGFFLVELRAVGHAENQYLFSCRGEEAFVPLYGECACRELELSVESDGVLVRNNGDVAALFVRLHAQGGVFAEGGFHVLPGQSRLVRCSGSAQGVQADWLNAIPAED